MSLRRHGARPYGARPGMSGRPKTSDKSLNPGVAIAIPVISGRSRSTPPSRSRCRSRSRNGGWCQFEEWPGCGDRRPVDMHMHMRAELRYGACKYIRLRAQGLDAVGTQYSAFGTWDSGLGLGTGDSALHNVYTRTHAHTNELCNSIGITLAVRRGRYHAHWHLASRFDFEFVRVLVSGFWVASDPRASDHRGGWRVGGACCATVGRRRPRSDAHAGRQGWRLVSSF